MALSSFLPIRLREDLLFSGLGVKAPVLARLYDRDWERPVIVPDMKDDLLFIHLLQPVFFLVVTDELLARCLVRDFVTGRDQALASRPKDGQQCVGVIFLQRIYQGIDCVVRRLEGLLRRRGCVCLTDRKDTDDIAKMMITAANLRASFRAFMAMCSDIGFPSIGEWYRCDVLFICVHLLRRRPPPPDVHRHRRHRGHAARPLTATAAPPR